MCPVCQKIITADMHKHRGSCNTCPFCDHKEKKKARLLKHMAGCTEKARAESKPLDLSSPKKEGCKERVMDESDQFELTKPKKEDSKTICSLKELPPQVSEKDLGGQEKNKSSTKLEVIDDSEIGGKVVGKTIKSNSPLDLSIYQINNGGGVSDMYNHNENTYQAENKDGIDFETVHEGEVSTTQKRMKYPFDVEDADDYLSELEENDEKGYTTERRALKDSLEIELRLIDEMKNGEVEGDEEIFTKFKMFMQKKKKRPGVDGEFSNMKQVSTVEMYPRAIKNHILPAFHRLVAPFDARWILDCTTAKQCTFEGELRRFVDPEEPIYMTSAIVKEALKTFDGYVGESGSQRGTLLAAIVEFLDFIEFHFNNLMSIFGPSPAKKLSPYHKSLRNYLKSTGAWRTSNEEKDKAHQTKKVMENYENPNKDLEILESYHIYIKGPERLSNFLKILDFSSDENLMPTNGEMTEFGEILMGEIVACTGCRPVVVRRLTVGSYADKTPGFNPRRISKDDCVIEETQDDQNIYRRVNPKLPPKDRACKHQIEEKTAECSVHCIDRCDPDGFNITVTWDKTQKTNGSSYLHLTKPLKVVMDCYDDLRSRFFKDKKPSLNSSADWLSEDETPFFLKSSCSEFKFLNLKHISEAMQCDVTTYSFRRIVCTWALSHENIEIQQAEEEALQHKLKVARDKYLQNKQLQPQRLTQTYIEEENLFPRTITDIIETTEMLSKSKVRKTEEKRAKKRYDNLMKGKATYKKAILEKKHLGPNHRVLAADRNKFKEFIQDQEDVNLESLITDMKPLHLRNFIVRSVCSENGTKGIELRKLWVKIYQGDLKWGVRDARFKSKLKKWPKNGFPHDRNSWIASSIRQSVISEKKRCDKNSYLKLI